MGGQMICAVILARKCFRTTLGAGLLMAAFSSVAQASISFEPPPVPEIDASSAAAALALLAGGTMLLKDRFRAT